MSSDCSALSLETDWQTLAQPPVCGLLALKPTRLSLAMHQAAFKAAKLDFSYSTFATPRTEVGLLAMRELGFRGLSLTLPHKEVALGLVDAISPEVQQIGAINTVINTGSRLVGLNTDCAGIERALAEVDWKAQASRVLVIGAGGAARAALHVLRTHRVPDIAISNRTEKRAEDLAALFGARVIPFAKLREGYADFDLCINSSSIGMPGLPQEQFPLDYAVFGSRHIVFDMVTAETKLIIAAQQQGACVVRGVRMLLHQAVAQSRLFTEKEPNIAVMEGALEDAYAQLVHSPEEAR